MLTFELLRAIGTLAFVVGLLVLVYLAERRGGE